MQKHNTRLQYLLTRYLQKESTRAEFEELFTYFDDPDYEGVVKTRMEQALAADPEALTGGLGGTLIADKALGKLQKQRARLVFRRAYMVAASVLLAAIAGIIWWEFMRSPQVEEMPYAVKMDQEIGPGGQRATLTLGDGSQIALDDAAQGKLAQQGNTAIQKQDDGTIAYEEQENGSKTQRVYMNTLTTPVAAQYMIVLPDHSKVWLNASSSLRYPTVFNGDERIVSLQGEAYFEIAKDPAHPFMVNTERSSVQVLGTHFNISDYPDEQKSDVTLCEGSIRLVVANKEKLMIPGQQASFAAEDEAINMHKIDTDEVIDWTQGYFLFDNADLNKVMSKIKRWYNIDVTFQGPQPATRFTGMISRNSDLSKILGLLQSTGGVTFEVRNRKVVVMHD